ncbi:MAG: aspartate:alanine exchanger family transporter [Myxococcota bacterium]
MAHFLHERPLLLLFGVSALGYLVGHLRIFGFSLGVAAVLFAGLFVGWWIPGVELPEFVAQLGLVLFVYTVGLASGPGFFASLRLRGLRDNALALGVLLVSFGVCLVLGRVLGLDGPTLSGLFAGSLTNTPALAAAVDVLKQAGESPEVRSAPVLAYSLCYPLGVLIPLLTVSLAERWFKVSYDKEPVSLAYRALSDAPIVNATILIDQDCDRSARELRKGPNYAVNFGRIRRGPLTSIVHDETQFLAGDVITVIGTERDVANVVPLLGKPADDHIELDRSTIDYRRMFVSRSELTERPLRDLHLTQKYDAVITRVRRGDVDLVPNGDFELMLGDRARVLAPRDRMPEIAKLLGDSVRQVAEIDVITFGLGITLGLLLGAIPIPVPGGGTFSFGLAGGPLIVGLILGRIGRTGSLVWSSPYGANMTLRQLGVVLFLAGVGIKAGGTLGHTLTQGPVWQVALIGALVTSTSVLLAIFVGHKLLRIPLGVMVGTLAGIQTQPAVLAFAVEKTGRDLPNVGYAAVYPLAMILKIVLAQIVFKLLG